MKPWVASYSAHDFEHPDGRPPKWCRLCGIAIGDYDYDPDICDRNTMIETDDKDDPMEPQEPSK